VSDLSDLAPVGSGGLRQRTCLMSSFVSFVALAMPGTSLLSPSLENVEGGPSVAGTQNEMASKATVTSGGVSPITSESRGTLPASWGTSMATTTSPGEPWATAAGMAAAPGLRAFVSDGRCDEMDRGATQRSNKQELCQRAVMAHEMTGHKMHVAPQIPCVRHLWAFVCKPRAAAGAGCSTAISLHGTGWATPLNHATHQP
jgi:hypothetical protein